MFGSSGCLIQKAAAICGRIRTGPIQMGSFTNGCKEDDRIEWGLKKNQLRLRPFVSLNFSINSSLEPSGPRSLSIERVTQGNKTSFPGLRQYP
jgi:hypothetical protein